MSKAIDIEGLPKSIPHEMQKLISLALAARAEHEPNHNQLLTPSEKLALFEQWLAGHAPSSVLADDSRESIYAGCGE